jgi:hypothetical protein
MVTMFTPESFRPYFFGNFTCIMVDATYGRGEFWKEDRGHDFWREVVLGAFYVSFALSYCDSLTSDKTQLSWSLLTRL